LQVAHDVIVSGLRLDASLEGTFASRARGRVVVIDAYRSWACGTWVGDITARFAAAAPADGAFVPAGTVEGVPVFVLPNLPGFLDAAGPSLHAGGVLRRGGLRVELDRPELWIRYLDRPDAWRQEPVAVLAPSVPPTGSTVR
jgi:hypothetical protein